MQKVARDGVDIMKNLLPMYYQIKETIKTWILDKKYAPGQRIPSADELSKHFMVSYVTVRQAIEHLEQEGFLVSRRGSGTFVANNEALANTLSTEARGFMDEIFYQVQRAKTKSVEMKVIETPTIVREKLKLGPRDRTIFEIKRVRFLDDQSFNFSTNYIPMEIGSQIVERDLFKKPLLQILAEDLGIKFVEALQVIQASFADQEVSEKLGIALGSPMLFLERILYTKHGKPVQMLQGRYRGDLFKYIVRLKNVRGKDGNVWVYYDQMANLMKGDAGR